MSHYAAGAKFERKVRDKLYADGAKLVVRSAGSKGPVDLVALYKRGSYRPWPRLVQVKRGRGMTATQRQALFDLALEVGGDAVVASPLRVGRRVEVRLEVL